jgi:hydroxymethylbilane synthase
MGEADATLLAAAGLDRLDHPEIGTPLDALLPAPAQGAVGIEILAGNRRLRPVIQAIDHLETHRCVSAERRLLEGLGGSCRSPVAALAQLEGGRMHLRAEILTNDGRDCQDLDTSFAADDLDAPLRLARHLLGTAAPPLRALFAG